MHTNFSIYDRFIKSTPVQIKNLNDLKKYYGLNLFTNDEFKSKRLKEPDNYIELSYLMPAESEFVTEDSWKYTINPWNFRNYWNFDDPRPKIGFFGCSFTFGEGIDTQDTFVDIVSKELDLNPFNFGTGGSGIERIARTISAVTNLIDIEYAVITIPTWHRMLHIDEDGNLINIVPRVAHSRFKELSEKLTSFEEEFYVVRALSYLNWIHDVLSQKNIAQRNIKFLFSSWDHPCNYLCKKIFSENTINCFPNIDNKEARDRLHPGVKSQRAHANQIIQAFYDKNWIQK